MGTKMSEQIGWVDALTDAVHNCAWDIDVKLDELPSEAQPLIEQLALVMAGAIEAQKREAELDEEQARDELAMDIRAWERDRGC